jgi:hypothetical protein
MIKATIDLYRARNGYAGMAIYRDGIALFCEGIEPELTERIRALFIEAESTFHSTYVTATIMGFTVSVNRHGNILIISRFEGKFVPPPAFIHEEVEYSTGEPAPYLITREEARREAEHLLGQLMP